MAVGSAQVLPPRGKGESEGAKIAPMELDPNEK